MIEERSLMPVALSTLRELGQADPERRSRPAQQRSMVDVGCTRVAEHRS